MLNLPTIDSEDIPLEYSRGRTSQPSRKSLAILFPEGRKHLIKAIKIEIERYMKSCTTLQTIRKEFTTGSEYDDLQRYFIDLFVDELMAHVLDLTRELEWIRGLLDQPEGTQRGLSPLDIEKAKQVDIADLMPNEVRQVGGRLIALCPFHEEKTGSFNIFPDNHYYCFGACAKGGDSIDFIMRLNNLTFPEAVKFLIGKS